MSNARWLEERRNGIGGSDVAAILGLSKWRTPYQVYLDKRGEAGEFTSNEAMEWGNILEPVIRQKYSDVTGRVVKVPEGILYHQKYPFMLANIDGFTDDPRLVEIKTARSAMDWGEDESGDIPIYYQCQVQHYMAVTGFPVADIPVLFGGSDFRIYEVESDPELQEMMIEAEAEFWQRVKDGNPPEPVTFADAVQRYGKSAATGIIEIGPGNYEDIQHLKQVRESIKRLEAEEEILKAEFIKMMGDAGDTLAFEGQPAITYKLSKGRALFDSKALEKEYPEIYAKFLKTGEPSRRFLLKG